MFGNATMPLFPCAHVREGHHVIRVFRRLLMNVEHNEGHQHVLGVDLVDSFQTFVKMRWRVDVSTPLSGMTEHLDEKSVLVNRIRGRDLLGTQALPVRSVRSEGMREIDEVLAR